MTSWDDIASKAHDLIDGRLTPEDERALRDEIARHPELARRLQELEWMVAGLGELHQERAPNDFASRVLGAIEREEDARAAGPPVIRPRWSWLAALAASVLVSAFALTAFIDRRPPPSQMAMGDAPQPEAAAPALAGPDRRDQAVANGAPVVGPLPPAPAEPAGAVAKRGAVDKDVGAPLPEDRLEEKLRDGSLDKSELADGMVLRQVQREESEKESDDEAGLVVNDVSDTAWTVSSDTLLDQPIDPAPITSRELLDTGASVSPRLVLRVRPSGIALNKPITGSTASTPEAEVRRVLKSFDTDGSEAGFLSGAKKARGDATPVPGRSVITEDGAAGAIRARLRPDQIDTLLRQLTDVDLAVFALADAPVEQRERAGTASRAASSQTWRTIEIEPRQSREVETAASKNDRAKSAAPVIEVWLLVEER